MSGPFDPSAGYGPAVSSGISVTDPLPLELDFVDPAAPEVQAARPWCRRRRRRARELLAG
jgi:hypothetical protein